MNKQKLEKVQHIFTITLLIGFIMLMVANETAWLDFLDYKITLLSIPLIIAISFVGIILSIRKIEVIESYEKGRNDEKLFQLIGKKKE